MIYGKGVCARTGLYFLYKAESICIKEIYNSRIPYRNVKSIQIPVQPDYIRWS
jgi:hypothetical protein